MAGPWRPGRFRAVRRLRCAMALRRKGPDARWLGEAAPMRDGFSSMGPRCAKNAGNRALGPFRGVRTAHPTCFAESSRIGGPSPRPAGPVRARDGQGGAPGSSRPCLLAPEPGGGVATAGEPRPRRSCPPTSPNDPAHSRIYLRKRSAVFTQPLMKGAPGPRREGRGRHGFQRKEGAPCPHGPGLLFMD